MAGSEARVVGLGCLLVQAFDKEAEVVSTCASEAFFIECISSLRDFIDSSMDVERPPFAVGVGC